MRPPKKLEVRYPTVMATNERTERVEGKEKSALIDGQATPMSVSGRPIEIYATKASTIRPISALPTRTDGDVSPNALYLSSRVRKSAGAGPIIFTIAFRSRQFP